MPDFRYKRAPDDLSDTDIASIVNYIDIEFGDLNVYVLAEDVRKIRVENGFFLKKPYGATIVLLLFILLGAVSFFVIKAYQKYCRTLRSKYRKR